MTKSHVILEYLQQVGAKKETEMYLKMFRGIEPGRFALVAIDAQTLAVYQRDVASALAYLSSLGLAPVVVHDATGALGKQLVSDIWSNGGKCQAIMTAIYSSDKDAVKAVAPKALELAAARTMPIIEAEHSSETIMQLLPALKPGKLIILNRFGGVRTRKDELLSYINLPNEYGSVMKAAAAEYHSVLKMASGALGADWKLHVEIVPPNGLLTELFTIKGSGTFAKKGPRIARLAAAAADKAKVKALIERSFGKSLKGNYLEKKDAVLFVEEDYNAVAVVEKVNGIFYIDKLAVLPEAQGEGLARDLITAAMASCKKVFWRARPENHINEWYQRLCSGMQKVGDWYVYWSNLSIDEVKTAVKYASEKPADFIG